MGTSISPAAPAKRPFSVADWVFRDAVVVGADHYVFVAHNRTALRRDVYRCQVIEYAGGVWRPLGSGWRWEAVGLAVTVAGDRRVDVVGRDGQVGTVLDGRSTETRLTAAGAPGPLRGVRSVGGEVYAFGMKPEVFRREATGAWTPVMDGLVPPLPAGRMSISEKMAFRSATLTGIDAMAVDGSRRLFAFGMKGAIWRLDGQRWSRVDSPATLMLHDATEWQDGTIYVCGQGGTLLHGSDAGWEVVPCEGPDNLDFRSICAFGGALFIADGDSLHMFSDDVLAMVDLGSAEVVPCAVVVAGAGRLLSVAGLEVWESTDGERWRPLLPPALGSD